MKDPERLADGSDAPGYALLRSARQYRVSDRTRQRALATMGLAASLTTTTAGKAATTGAATSAKVWLIAGLVAATGGYIWLTPKAHPSLTGAASAAPHATVRAPVEVGNIAPEAASASAIAELEARASAIPAPALSTYASSPAKPDATRRDALGASSGRPATEDLTAELGALDTIARSIRKGEGATALNQLDAYARAFPHGSLNLEAAVLRVEALERACRHAEAASRAGAFVSKHATSPLAERMRQIAGM